MPSSKPGSTRRRARHVSKSEKSKGPITVENVNVPGHTTRVDANMYNAMRRAMLKVLPSRASGMTQNEMREAVIPHLPQKLYLGGAKAGWGAKMVQPDLEAKGADREETKPLRWHRDKSKCK